jgi:hypothetical protein
MLPRMLRSGPGVSRCIPRSTPKARAFVCLAALALANACAVYSSDLIDDAAAGVTTSGSDGASAGHGSSLAGKPSGGGGKTASVETPGAGGDQGPSESGSAAAGTPTSTGGATNTTGNAGSAGNGTTPNAGSGTTPSAGGSGVAGSGSVAGSSGAGGSPVTPAGDLLDGFEDEDLTLEQTSGRGGVWYLFDDGTVGTLGPTPLVCSLLVAAPPELGQYGMHVTASGFTSFGTGLGVDFRAGKKPYDGSKLSGIRFWARVGDGKNTRHRLQIADATTDKAGGKCNPAADAPNGAKCDDHFGINKTFTSSWASYVIRFDELSQIGWGNAGPALDKTTLYGLQVTAKAKLEVDLWLDQIEFF